MSWPSSGAEKKNYEGTCRNWNPRNCRTLSKLARHMICRKGIRSKDEYPTNHLRRWSQAKAAKETRGPLTKESNRLMKGKYYRCGENHKTDQCSQKGNSLKCTSCGKKGHIAKACYTDMLKKSGAIKTNTVQASPIPGQLAITQEATSLPTRMIRATISANTTSSTEHNLPMVQPAGQVEVDGRIVNLDAPPKPIPNLWL